MLQGSSGSEQNTNAEAGPAGRGDAGSAGAATARIRALNDRLRQTGEGGRVMVTAGIAALPRDEQLGILAAVRAFDGFTPDNDPHGEHDLGTLRIGVHRVMWKIDAYDLGLRLHSPDPADPAVTARVIVIMLAEEY